MYPATVRAVEMRGLSVHIVKWVAFHHERITFWVLEAFNFKINIEVWPFDGSVARHLDI